jgi:hypothetical protein
MGPPCPPHWSFAARAAYFGDRMCAFCDHRNPADARYCNACASPLDLKPCKRCDAVNDHAATCCHSCGAAYPALPHEGPGTGDALVPEAPPPRAEPSTRPRWHRRETRRFVVAVVIAVIALGYGAYRASAPAPEALEAASPRIVAAPREQLATEPEPVALTGPSPVSDSPGLTESEPGNAVTTADLRLPPAAVERGEAPTAARVNQRAPPAVSKKHATAPRRVVSERPVTVSAAPRAARNSGSTHAAAPGAQARKSSASNQARWLNVGLARCRGDIFARVVCEQRVRLNACRGRWGKAPECAGRIVNDHGQ